MFFIFRIFQIQYRTCSANPFEDGEGIAMNIKMHRDITGDIHSPTLLAGWPGMGNVGVGAIDYIRRGLEAVPFAEVEMNEYFSPDAVEVKNGIAKLPDLPSQVFYYVQHPELIIFESETQTAGPGGVALMTRMLDFAQQLKVGTIFTGAAFAMPISHRQPARILGVANRESLRDTLVPHGIQVLQERQITGLNGLFLAVAGMRNIQAACLMATIPRYATNIPNPKASREIVRVFERLLGIRVDTSEMDDAVEQMDQTMAEIEEKIQEAFASMLESEEVEEGDLEQISEEQVPQVVMEMIERLFQEVQAEGSKEKAVQLKMELDRWNLYSLYEDRFLNLFREDQESSV